MRYTIVGVQTHYVLDVSWFQDQWGEICVFPASFHPYPGAYLGSFTSCTKVIFPGVKRSGNGIHHLPHLAPRIRQVNGPLLPLCTFLACYRENFTFGVVWESESIALVIRNTRVNISPSWLRSPRSKKTQLPIK